MITFSDPLAAALWEARATAQPLARSDWRDVDLERGHRVAAELYAALRGRGARGVGAKVGATNAAAQAALGTDRPFVGPLYSDACVPSGTELSLADLIAPSLELEIGLRVGEGDPAPVACVEIVDSRFAWDVTIGHATADFGCQARMLFGAPAAGPVSRVRAVARRDGREVASGEAEVAAVAPQLALARPEVVVADGGAALVATGSLIAPVPLEAGEWELDFGELGVLELVVRP